MKRTNTILVVILLMGLAGCGGNKQSNDGLITVDLSKSYPNKELILQDIMDVEYIVLETTDEFLTQGLVRDVGEQYLVVTNRVSDGDIFIFDRKTGKGIRKINRKGEGAEEYVRVYGVILDETNGEIFVNSPGNKIPVYDLYGNFKRCLNLNQEVASVLDYDKDNLIGYDMSEYNNKGQDRNKSYHIIISKQDGSITREIFIPFKTINTPVVNDDNGFVVAFTYHIRPSHGKWTLNETSSDTLYNYAPDGTLIPFIARTPSAHDMDPEIFLYMGIHTDRYYFMEAKKNIFDFEKGRGFPSDELVYDKEENTLYQFTVYNGDYAEKRTVAMTANPINSKIENATTLDAFRLIEIYEKGQLKDGRLKEIASQLDEEDNPVIMLMKQKK